MPGTAPACGAGMKKSICILLVLILLLTPFENIAHADNPLAITRQPVSVTAAAGSVAEFSVEALGDGLSYQWQYHYADGATWRNWGTDRVKSFTVTSKFEGLAARCIVTDSSGNSVTSNIVTVHVGDTPVGITITRQPEDVLAPAGTAVEFSVEAEGEGLSYQWQYHYASGTSWKSWGTGNVKTVTASQAFDGLVARCVITDSSGNTVYTNEVTLRIPAAAAITRQPQNITAAVGATAEFSIEAIGDGLSYQWQYHYADGTTWRNWGTDRIKSFRVSASFDGLAARCIVTDSYGNSVTSDTVTVHVGDQPTAITITRQPVDLQAAVGDTAEFSIEAAGEGLSYQWQYHYADGVTWRNWGTDRTKSFRVSASFDGLVARCIVTDSYGNSVTSNTVTVHVGDQPVGITITRQPTDVLVSVGAAFEFSVEAEGEGLNYQWQYHYAGGTSWRNWGTGTVKTAKASQAFDGLVARCVITDSSGNIAYSNEVTLHLSTALTITQQPESITAAVGSVAEFSIEATGDSLSYQWQYHYADTTTWRNWGTDRVKSFTVSSKFDGLSARCIVTDREGNSVTSLEVTLTVDKTTHTVTYSAGNGQFQDGASTHSVTANAGIYTIAPEAPTWEGHAFLGWTLNGSTVRRFTLSADTTLTAAWEEQFFVEYDANGGAFADGEETHGSYENSGTYYIDHEEPVWANHRFLGWTVNGSYVKKVSLSGSLEVVAQWESAIPVTYDANGGFWLYPGQAPIATATDYLPEGVFYPGYEEPERDGYEFDGWTVNGRYVRKMILTEPITVQAQWRKEVTVTYNANGGAFWNGDTGRNDSAMAGEYYVAYETPEREDYAFIGWSTDPNATTAQREWNTTLTADTTFYAIWGPIPFVTYDASDSGWLWWNEDGSKTVSYSHQSDYGEVESARDRNASREEEWYEFAGWTTDPTAEDPTTVESFTITGSVTLYPVWRKLPTVTYNGNGGSWTYYIDDVRQETTTQIQWDQPGNTVYVEMWQPQRQGYDFDGWMDAAVNGNPVAEGSALVLNQDYVLYAKWLKNIQITYNANGGTFNGYDSDRGETSSIHYRNARGGDTYNLDGWQPEREGYRFLGWTLDAQNKDSENAALCGRSLTFAADAGDVTLYAVWAQQIGITYHGQGGVWNIDDDVVTYRTDWQNSGRVYYVRFEMPYREGYSFNGWVDAQGAAANDRELTLARGTEYDFYATWTKLISLTYNANGGAFDGWYSDESSSEHYRNTWTEQEYRLENWRPQREGYLFLGWTTDAAHKDDGTAALCSDTLTLHESDDNIVFYAVWSPAPVVTYDANGGAWDWTEDTTYSEAYEPGEYHFYMSSPEREGYEFLGWSEDPEAVEGEYDFDYTVTGDVTFYAIWDELAVVTYDADGGTFPDNNEVITWYARPGSILFVGQEIEEPSREGYRFLGWNYNGMHAGKIRVTGDITLTAEWEQLFTLTFDCNGGTLDAEEIITAECEDGLVLDLGTELDEPTRLGYVFLGWALNGELQNRVRVTEDMTLVAQWEQVGTCTVTVMANGGCFDDDPDITQRAVTLTVGDKLENVFLYINMSHPSEEEELRYTYFYWDADCSGDPIPKDFIVTEDITVYSAWAPRGDVLLHGNTGRVILYGSNLDYFRVVCGQGHELRLHDYDENVCTEDGREFLGWYYDPECTIPADDTILVNARETHVYAKWSDEPGHTVTFDGNGGTIWGRNTISFFVVQWHNIGFSVDVACEGFDFDGWCLSPYGDGDWVDPESYIPRDDVTLYAIWVDGPIEIDENSFPDEAFRALVSENFDQNQDGCLSFWERCDVETIEFDATEVASLQGIELFPNLTELTNTNMWDGTPLLSAVNLSGNSQLRSVTLGFTNLSSLDVSMLPNLRYLMVGQTNISSLDLSYNGELRELICSDCNLTSLDLSRNPYLWKLDVCGNPLTSLDLSDCPSLSSDYQAGGRRLAWLQNANPDAYARVIVFGGNGDGGMDDHDYNLAVDSTMLVNGSYPQLQVIAIDATAFPDDAFRTYLTNNVDSDGNGALSLDERNAVTTMVVTELGIADLSGIEFFGNLRQLFCEGNQLTTLDVSANGKLIQLYCNNNQLTRLVLGNSLQDLDCHSNNLSSVDVSANTGLLSLDCSGNHLQSLNISQNTQLSTLYCNGNQLTSLDISACPDLLDLVANGAHTSDGYALNGYYLCFDEGVELITLSYAITFDAGDGYFTDNAGTTLTCRVVPGNCIDDVPEVAHSDDHMFFDGWNTEPDGSGTNIDPYNYEPQGNMTLYPVWTPCYIVTVDANGGSFDLWTYYVPGLTSDHDDSTHVHRLIKQGEACQPRFGPGFINLTNEDETLAIEGWYFDAEYEDFACSALGSFTPEDDVTVYAKWSTGYSVTINGNGSYVDGEPGVTEKTIRVAPGQLCDYWPSIFRPISEDNAWVAPSHTFAPVALYLTAEGGDPVYEDSFIPDDYVDENGHVTLYARIVPADELPETYEVVLNANGGWFEPTWGRTYTYHIEPGSKIPEYYIPRHTNPTLTFAGWYDNADGTGDPVDLDEFVPEEDTQLYAKWNTILYTITYNANGGYWADDNSTARNRSYQANTILGEVPVEPVRDGFTFVGWYFNTDGTGNVINNGEYLVTGNATVYAVWSSGQSQTRYAVTFDANGYYFNNDPSNTSRTVYMTPGDTTHGDFDDAIVTTPTLKMVDGWYLEPACTNRVIDFDVHTPDYTPTGDITLYAHWVDAVKISLDANGGYHFSNPQITRTDIYMPKGEPMHNRRSMFAQRDNYAIDCWAFDAAGNDVVNTYDYTPNADVVFYAQWAPLYTITFNANGGHWADDNSTARDLYFKANTILSEVPVDPVRDDYTFLGWYLNTDGTGNVINNGQYTVTGSVTVYAVWQSNQPVTEPTTYTVTYNANGGTFPGGGTSQSGTFTEDYLTENGYYVGDLGNGNRVSAPTREGYIFSGWSESQTWTEGDTVYDDGSLNSDGCPSGMAVTDDVDLYACWEVDEDYEPEPTTYTVTYNANGGTFPGGGTSQSGTFTEDYLTENGYYVGDLGNGNWVDTPQREGYEFCGWLDSPTWTEDDWLLDDGSLNSDGCPSGMEVTGDVVLYACWLENEPEPEPEFCSVIFNANGGAFADEEQTHDELVDAGSLNLGDFEEPTREGYLFNGWTLNGSPVTTIEVSGDVTVYASWEQVDPGPEPEPEPEPETCPDCGGVNGEHTPDCPNNVGGGSGPADDVCPSCGLGGGEHTPDCPNNVGEGDPEGEP